MPSILYVSAQDSKNETNGYVVLQIGSWYRSSEINRRSTLFMFSSVGGQMFSGYIQAGLSGVLPGIRRNYMN